MNEKEMKRILKANKKVSIRKGTNGWSAYFASDFHFMIGDAAGIAYRFRYQDPLTGKISWSEWKNCRYDKITEEDVNLLLANLNNLT
jgi:hypothetical protein